MKYIISAIYTAIITSLYFMFLYREDVSPVVVFIVQIILFSPILLVLTETKLNLLKINILTILGFCVGFTIIALITNNNIWPIALVAWVIFSVPAILILNIISYVYKRKNA